MSGKFIVIAIGMIIGLAMTPVVASAVSTTALPSSSFPTGTATAIRSILDLVPLVYVAAILLTPIYFLFRGRGKGGM